MESKNRYDGLDVRVVATISYHARRLAAQRAVPGMEVEDYEQDLVLDLLRRQSAFDASKATFATFAECIITNRVATLTTPTRRLRAERAMISLDVPAGDGNDDEEGGHPLLVDLIPESGGIHPADDLPVDERLGLAKDVGAFLRALPLALCRCAGIIVADNVAGAARAAGINRSTVYEGVVRLRRRAVQAGLAIYLGHTPTPAAARR